MPVWYNIQGLTKDNVTGHIRVLQRKIAKLKEQIKSCQVGRIDLSIPSRCVCVCREARYNIIVVVYIQQLILSSTKGRTHIVAVNNNISVPSLSIILVEYGHIQGTILVVY